ncbi:hypothetical protein ACJX0J_022735, partial [Zea mays]
RLEPLGQEGRGVQEHAPPVYLELCPLFSCQLYNKACCLVTSLLLYLLIPEVPVGTELSGPTSNATAVNQIDWFSKPQFIGAICCFYKKMIFFFFLNKNLKMVGETRNLVIVHVEMIHFEVIFHIKITFFNFSFFQFFFISKIRPPVLLCALQCNQI